MTKIKWFQFHRHVWGKWRQYYSAYTLIKTSYFGNDRVLGDSLELRQKRVCEECGKMQDVKVN
jgi:hypothetical protein